MGPMYLEITLQSKRGAKSYSAHNVKASYLDKSFGLHLMDECVLAASHWSEQIAESNHYLRPSDMKHSEQTSPRTK